MRLQIQLVIVMSCSFVVAGCKGTETTPGTANSGAAVSPSPSSGGAAPSTGDTARDGILRSFRAQFDLKSYRMRMETTSSKTGPQVTVAEFVAPDRFHWTGAQNEMIVIGSSAYMKVGGRWTRSPVDAGAIVSMVRDPAFLDELSKSANVRMLGQDILDGTQAVVYEYSLANLGGTGMSSTSKSWVRASDGLPLKVESTGSLNGVKTRTLITYYDFNTDIKIEPPL
jgi:hypothetical protein